MENVHEELMKKGELLKAVEVSGRTSRLLQSLENEVFDWAEKKEKLYKKFFNQAKKYPEMLQEMSEEWLKISSNQFVGGKVFGDPSKLKKALTQRRNNLSGEEKRLIRSFLEYPWYYSLFSVEEQLGKNFFKVYDYSKNASLLLFSEGVQEEHRRGASLFLCLLLNNGECHQTYGIINSFLGFTVKDFKTFAGFMDPTFTEIGELSRSILKDPLPYMLLFNFADISIENEKGESIEFCSHSIPVSQFDPSEYKGIFNIEEKEDVIMLSLIDDKGQYEISKVFFDKNNKKLYIHAYGTNEYQAIASTLKDQYEFPDEPSWRVSAQLELALDSILGVRPPGSELGQIFNEDSDESMKVLNSILMEISENYNNGIKHSAEDLSEKYNYPVEKITQLQKEIERKLEGFEIDLQGGLENFGPPPPVDRIKFRESFQNNSIFEFQNNSNTTSYLNVKLPGLVDDLEYFEYETISINQLAEFIEDMFFDFWEVSDSTILLYTIYLLSQKGDSFHEVKNYGVEVLKLFWQALIPSKDKELIKAFIEDYGFFCLDILYKTGLIEINRTIPDVNAVEDVDFKIKASPFFYSWIRFIQSN
jgi:hypothetical protein